MTDPGVHGVEAEFDVDAELVKDLDVDDDHIGAIAGGNSAVAGVSRGPVPSRLA